MIIGNPPWAEYAKVKNNYSVKNYQTEACGNLHSICTERGIELRSPYGYMSFIVQLPMVNSSRMGSVRQLLKKSSSLLHVISFGDRPGKLFEGLEHSRATIWLSRGTSKAKIFGSEIYTTRYQRWSSEFRPFLFDLLEYAQADRGLLYPDQFPKYANYLETKFSKKLENWGLTRSVIFQTEVKQSILCSIKRLLSIG